VRVQIPAYAGMTWVVCENDVMMGAGMTRVRGGNDVGGVREWRDDGRGDDAASVPRGTRMGIPAAQCRETEKSGSSVVSKDGIHSDIRGLLRAAMTSASEVDQCPNPI